MSVDAARWPATSLSLDFRQPIDGAVCATMWPTRSLDTDERWFDELYVWTEGFQATTTQRARIQLAALENALAMLESKAGGSVGITLSFGTVERYLDLVAEAFDAHRFVAHRVAVLLRGSMDRLRSRYRIRAFVELMRAQKIVVGYRVTTPRVSMELKALDFIQPDFAKLLAPSSQRLEYWQDFAMEARVAGIPPDWLIVAGLENAAHCQLAKEAGIRFGQGTGVRRSYAPHSKVPLNEAPPTLVDTLPPHLADRAEPVDTSAALRRR